MTTQKIADRLVELCRKGDFEAAQTELYAMDAISDEPKDSPLPHAEGREAIIEKGRHFQSMLEKVHSIEVGDPIVANNAFSCALTMDVTMKGQERSMMAEICSYVVKDGRIVSERFTW
jgi:hypothetical protein